MLKFFVLNYYLLVYYIYFIIFIVTCPEGMEKILGRCYKFSSNMQKKSLTWRQAQVECQNLPGNYDLVTVDSKELNDALKVHNDHWIGLHDMFHEGQLKWANGQVFEGFGSTFGQEPWSRNQPDVSYNDILTYWTCIALS